MNRFCFFLTFLPALLFSNIEQYGPRVEPFKILTDESGAKTFLLSAPRSGFHWFAYVINRLTDRYVNPGGNLFLYNRLATPFTYEKAPILFFHSSQHFQKSYNPALDKIILLVRNYKENLIRNFGQYKRIKDAIDSGFDHNEAFDLISHLEFFEAQPENQRLLVYYEDLIARPEETYEAILDFLGEDKSRISSFLEHLTEHKQYVINLYNSKWYGPSRTEGNLAKKHSEKLTQGQLNHLDQLIEAMNPELYHKYLSHYAE